MAKFCKQCGARLVDPCPSCGHDVAADVLFCDNCGKNVADVIETQIREIEEALLEARRLQEACRFGEVSKRLGTLSIGEHSRLKVHRDYFVQFQTKFAEYRRCREEEARQSLQKAKQFFEEINDAAAIACLDKIHEALQTEESRELVARATARQSEINRLEQQIAHGLASKQTSCLLSRVEKLLKLSPRHEQASKLLEPLRRKQVERDERQWDTLRRTARHKVQENRWDEARRLLTSIPIEHRREKDSQVLEFTEEVCWLQRNLQTSPFVDSALLEVAKRLIKLTKSSPYAIECLQEVRQKSESTQRHLPIWKPPVEPSVRFPFIVQPLAELDGLQVRGEATRKLLRASSLQFNTAIGLALQGIELAPITTNLASRKGGGLLGKISKVVRRPNSSCVAWGIDIGTRFLKTVRLERADGEKAIITDTQIIEFPTADGLEATVGVKQSVIADWKKQMGEIDGELCLGIPGVHTLIKVIEIPPVPNAKLPEAIRFEMQHQIPFPVEQLQWDYQVLDRVDAENSKKKIRVLLVAIKEHHFSRHVEIASCLGKEIRIAQGAGIANLNAAKRQQWAESCDPATRLSRQNETQVILDIGETSTNLLVEGPDALWFRSFYFGAMNFTQAVVTNMKFTQEKAERLIRNQQTAKSMYQLNASLQPAFDDLGDHIQRSLASAQRECGEFTVDRLLVLGGGTYVHGLLKYLTVDETSIELQ